MTAIDANLVRPLADLLLACADDKLMLGHRNSDWTGLAPILEEDIAFSSLAQDEMAHASVLYDFVAEMLGDTADRLAFGRSPEEYRCAAIVETSDEFDWATAIARQFFCDHFDLLRLGRFARSSHETLAQLAARLEAEERMHVRHVDDWVGWLGRGTDESRSKMQAALDQLATIAPMLFEKVDGQQALTDAGLYSEGESTMFDAWRSGLQHVAGEAGLRLEIEPPNAESIGGRRGVHTEHFAPLLDEMCEVYRLEPNAAW